MTSVANCQMIVAHRGASYDAPENTLSAFREAWEQGADGIEGDFFFTLDRQLVCIHDKDTLRTAGKKLSVANSSLQALRQLEYGKWKSAEFAGEPLPTFAEVAQSVPADKTFVIELKTGPDIVPLLVGELSKLPLQPEQLLIIAFDAATIRKAKEMLPEIRAHWLTSFKQSKLTGRWSPTAEEILQTLHTCRADGLGSKGERAVLTKDFVGTLRDGGLREFHVWTVDEPEDAKYFQQLGAVGITTNRPALIRQALHPANP